MAIIPESTHHLHIGSLIFPKLDQMDFTGPFEIFSRIPNSTYHIVGKETKPLRDTRGLILVPEKTFSEVPALDLLHMAVARSRLEKLSHARFATARRIGARLGIADPGQV